MSKISNHNFLGKFKIRKKKLKIGKKLKITKIKLIVSIGIGSIGIGSIRIVGTPVPTPSRIILKQFNESEMKRKTE